MNITPRFKLLPISLAVSVALSASPSFAQAQDENLEKNVEVIQVTGLRSSLTKSMQLKQDAASIQDSIVAEDIGKFPDQNVAESLQRISGVMISRTNGEGSQITVRGLGPEFNSVKVNNRTLATTERGREFDFQVLPSELISSADVIKASRANISEGSIGAYVTVNTARPLDSVGEKFVGSVHGKYNDLAEATTPKLAAIYSNTYMDDKFGLLIGVSHLESENRIDAHETAFWDFFNIEAQTNSVGFLHNDVKDTAGNTVTEGPVWYPGRVRYATDIEERKRTSLNATLQYAPTEDVTFTFDALYSDFSRQAFSNGLQVPLQRPGWKDVIINENRTAVSGEKLWTQVSDGNGGLVGVNHPLDGLFQQRGEESKTTAIGFNTLVYNDRWTFEADVSYSKAEATPRGDNFVPNIVGEDTNPDPDIDTGFETTDNVIWDSNGSDIIQIESTFDWADPAGVRAHWNMIGHQELEDEVLEVKFDTTYNFEGDFSYIQTIDFGISYSDREKSQDVYNSVSTQCGNTFAFTDDPRNVTTCDTLLDMDDALFSFNSTSDFLSNEAGSFPRDFIYVSNRAGYISGMANLTNEPAWGAESLVANDTVSNTEETLALYAQANFEGEAENFIWSGNFGLRYVDTESSSDGFAVLRTSVSLDETSTDGDVLSVGLTEPSLLSEKSDYSKLLPSLNVSLNFNNGFFTKFAASKAITRPALSDVGVNRTYSHVRANEFSTTQGNPFLKPYEATQFDVSFEFYQESGNSYSASLFYKDFSSWIAASSNVVDSGYDINLDRDASTGLNGNEYDLPETVNKSDNRSGVKLQGFELAALHYFDYLPGWASGFGVQANYTYTNSSDSEAISTASRPGVISAGSGVEGFSKNAYNFIVFYDKDQFQTRLAYNWRSEYLLSRSSLVGQGLPNHSDAYGQLDFSSSYDINDNFTVSAEVINLTDENVLQYADSRERVTLLQYSGRRFQIGLTAKF